MDYEKAYKDALEKARAFELIEHMNIMASIFPELKESEDEKIRKALIKGVEHCKASGWTNFGNNVDIDVVLAWLEKQGKPTTIDIDKMVLKYSQTRETCTNGLPVNCQIRAYRQGINDTLEKQGEQKPVEDKDAERASADYRNFRMSCGINDPVMLNEIEEAYYEGAISRKSATWSEEDKDFMYDTLSNLTELKDRYGEGYGNVGKCIDWLKSIKDRIGG